MGESNGWLGLETGLERAKAVINSGHAPTQVATLQATGNKRLLDETKAPPGPSFEVYGNTVYPRRGACLFQGLPRARDVPTPSNSGQAKPEIIPL